MTGLPWARRRADSGDPVRPRRRRGLLLAIGGLLVVVVGANFVAARLIESKVAQAAEGKLHASTAVSLSGPPALIDLVTGSVPGVQLTSSAISLCKLGGLGLAASLTNVSDQGSQLSVGSTQASVTIGPGSISKAIGKQLQSATIHPDPADQLIDVDAGPAGLVELKLRPVLSGHTLSARLVGVSLLGSSASRTVVRRLQQHIHFSRTLEHLPLNLTPTDVSVTAQGINLRLSGGSWQGDTSSGSSRQTCT